MILNRRIKSLLAIALSVCMICSGSYITTNHEGGYSSASLTGIQAYAATSSVATPPVASSQLILTSSTPTLAMSGGLAYDSVNKTITLNGYDFTGAMTAIYIDNTISGDITINVQGTNTINATSGGSGIYVQGTNKLIFTGSGSLNVNSVDQAAIYTGGKIDFDGISLNAVGVSGKFAIIAIDEITLKDCAATTPIGAYALKTTLIDGLGNTFDAYTIAVDMYTPSDQVDIKPIGLTTPIIKPDNGYTSDRPFDATITMNDSGNSTIYYTIDGTTPTVSSDSISSGSTVNIPITSTMTTVTLQAIAITPTGAMSQIATATYTYQKKASTGGGSSGGGGGGGGGGGSSSGPKTTAGNGSGSGVSALGSWQKNATGWWFKKIDGTWPANTWYSVGMNKWYFFNAQGYMQTGWIISGGKSYYLEENPDSTEGLMVTGWKSILGNWYYFNVPNGDMAVNTTTPDNYYVGADGVWRQ